MTTSPDAPATPAGTAEPALLLPPVLPGLAPRRRLGGGPGAPWVARTDDGQWVVVRRGRPPVDLPEHDALLPVLGQVRDSAGEPWAITSYRTGSGLDRRLDRVRCLDPALARSVGEATATALAVLHENGLAHTGLDASRVLLGIRDQVVLEASCARPGSAADRQDDLDRFATLLDSLTGSTRDGLLEAVAARARRGDGPAELAGALRAGRAPSRARHARGADVGRRLAAGAVVAGLVATAAVLGVRLAGDPAPTASLDSPAVAIPVEVVDWVGVLTALDRARGAAFATPDPALLGLVDAPGSPALARDEALVETLRRNGLVAERWATRVLGVRPSWVRADTALLRVSDRMPGYVLRDAAGRIVKRYPPRGEHEWRIRLVRTTEGWRIASVDRVEPGATTT